MPDNVSAGFAAGLRLTLREAKRVVIFGWDEQKDEATCAAEMNVSHQSSFQVRVRADWRVTQWQNLLFILISWLDLCKNEDNNFEKRHHKCVSLFCCIFLLRLKTWCIQSILLLLLHWGLVNCRSKRVPDLLCIELWKTTKSRNLDKSSNSSLMAFSNEEMRRTLLKMQIKSNVWIQASVFITESIRNTWIQTARSLKLKKGEQTPVFHICSAGSKEILPNS